MFRPLVVVWSRHVANGGSCHIQVFSVAGAMGDVSREELVELTGWQSVRRWNKGLETFVGD